jgi:phosphoribosylglycinamide formyltransferase-1
MKKWSLAIFASGTGTNAANLIRYFQEHPQIEIGFVLTNNAQAGVIQKCSELQVPIEIISNQQANDALFLRTLCQTYTSDFIILAGYLRLIPELFSSHYSKRIINIHPSLLPKYGGKGMYGDFVHHAVLENGEKESGISIHFVDAAYDEGELIAQFSCEIEPGETLATLKEKISRLEQLHYPRVIEKLIQLSI